METAKLVALVTGATGAIGPVLVRYLLAQGWTVRALVYSQDQVDAVPLPAAVTLYWGDINDGAVLQTAVSGATHVFHLAAKLHINSPSPDLADAYRQVNVEGTRQLYEAARAAGVRRFVFFSTIAVYGPSAGDGLLTESSPVNPDSLYAQTKLQAEKIVLSEGGTAQMETVVLRLAAVYGGRVKGNYQRLLQAMRRNRFWPLGSGQNWRTLVYDVDVARAAHLAAVHPKAGGQVFNVTDGTVHTLDEILGAMRLALGKRPYRWQLPIFPIKLLVRVIDMFLPYLKKKPVLSDTLNKYLENVAVDGQKISKMLGFEPEYDLKLGWQEIVDNMAVE